MRYGVAMTAWSPGRARTFLLFGIALALAGLAALLLLAWHSLLRAAQAVPMLDFRPHLPPEALIDVYASLPAVEVLGKLNDLQTGLVYAGCSAVIMALGILLARRQVILLRAARRWREDALRRVRQYRESSQVQDSPAQTAVCLDVRIGKDADWISPAHDRGTESIRRTG